MTPEIVIADSPCGAELHRAQILARYAVRKMALTRVETMQFIREWAEEKMPTTIWSAVDLYTVALSAEPTTVLARLEREDMLTFLAHCRDTYWNGD